MKIVCKQLKGRKENKCHECNWTTYTLYTLYGTDKKKIDKEGLCANCFMQMLYEEGWEILPAKTLYGCRVE